MPVLEAPPCGRRAVTIHAARTHGAGRHTYAATGTPAR